MNMFSTHDHRSSSLAVKSAVNRSCIQAPRNVDEDLSKRSFVSFGSSLQAATAISTKTGIDELLAALQFSREAGSGLVTFR